MPSDLTGVSVYNQLKNEFEFRKGPLFANIVLADEINRTTPKTQSALLEAMSEERVTVEDTTYPLPKPFMMVATQNPVEYHGSYPLPESQLDRFLLRIQMGYPDEKDEKEIVRSQISYENADEIEPVISVKDVQRLQRQVLRIHFEEVLLEYLLAIVRRTRSSKRLDLGISPRGAMALYRAAQARALVKGRKFCIPDDVKVLVLAVFCHRVLVSPRYASPLPVSSEAESILRELMAEVEVPL